MAESGYDNTGIISMQKGFDAFMSRSWEETDKRSKRLRLDDSHGSLLSTDANDVSMTASLHELDRNIEARKQAAELIRANTKVIDLEDKLEKVEMLAKKTKLDLDVELNKLKQRLQDELDNSSNLGHQLSQSNKCTEALRDQINDLHENLNKTKLTYEQKILSFQKEKTQTDLQRRQVEEELRQKFAEVKSKLMCEQAEKEMIKIELDEVKDLYSVQSKKLKDVQGQERELEAERNKRVAAAELRVHELTEQLATFEDERARVSAARSDLERLTQWRKEIEVLREKNKQLRDTQENVHLAKEMLESMKQKLQRNEGRLQHLVSLEAENEELHRRIALLESDEKKGNDTHRSPLLPSKQLAEFRSKEVLHLAALGSLKVSLHAYEEEARVSAAELTKVKAQCSEYALIKQQQDDLIKRLQRKLLLISKERDGFKRVMDSFESEVTLDVATPANSRAALLEQTIGNYRKMTESLEEELRKKSEELSVCRVKCTELEERLSKSETAALTSSMAHDAEANLDRKTVDHLRSEIEELHKAIEESAKEKLILQTRIEQRHWKGDYDPATTKVLHLTMNPLAMARMQRVAELERLRSENERLTERLRVVEEAAASGERADVTALVEKRLQEPGSSRDLQELKSQLTSAELKCQRLTEAYQKRMQELREVVYQLTGYRIDMSLSNQYTLTSQYAESANDYLIFQQSSGGLQLLATDFTATLRDLVDLHLTQQNSIPVFLAALTAELFSRQTVFMA